MSGIYQGKGNSGELFQGELTQTTTLSAGGGVGGCWSSNWYKFTNIKQISLVIDNWTAPATTAAPVPIRVKLYNVSLATNTLSNPVACCDLLLNPKQTGSFAKAYIDFFSAQNYGSSTPTEFVSADNGDNYGQAQINGLTDAQGYSFTVAQTSCNYASVVCNIAGAWRIVVQNMDPVNAITGARFNVKIGK